MQMKPRDEKHQHPSYDPMHQASRTKEITQEYQNALLTEYSLAHNYVWKFDSAIWQTAAVFISAALAGFVLIAQNTNFTPSSCLTASVSGISAILVLLGWYGMVIRWESYKRILFFRLREIEQDLGLWENRYLEHIYTSKVSKVKSLNIINENDKARFRRLEQGCPSIPGFPVTSLIKVAVIGFSIGWGSLILINLVFTFII